MAGINHSQRLVSLDQFRGYTVAGMFLVNFLGGYAVCPEILRHRNDYVSYADTIMPQFLFAVGFAMRLTLTRKSLEADRKAVRLRMMKRLMGLVLVSWVLYTASVPAGSWQDLSHLGWWGAIREPLKRGWFQTLMHIAVTSLWVLPVVQSGGVQRLLWVAASALLHVWLSALFNFEWVNTDPTGIDGGPLGFLAWTVPLMAGTFACDLFASPATRERPFWGRVAWGTAGSVAIMLFGYLLSCGTRLYDVLPSTESPTSVGKLAASPVWPSQRQIELKTRTATSIRDFLAEPPFVPPPAFEQRQWNYWMMSQRASTLSYVVFTAGLSLAVFVAFYVLCDVYHFHNGFLRTFGTNALLAYVLHDLVASAVKPFTPSDAPVWYVSAALCLFFSITWSFVRHFEKNGFYLRA